MLHQLPGAPRYPEFCSARRSLAARVPRLVIALLVAAVSLACAPAAAPAPAPAAKPAAPAAPAAPTSAAAPAAPTSAPAAAREPATVRITDIQITSAAGSYIAAAKGYFREEGIQAEFVSMGAGDQIPSVVSGTADVTGAAINAFLFNALARGLPLKMVADHGANLPNASAGGFVVRKDLVDSGAYRGPADARGWKIAMGTPGGTTDIALDRFLQTGGLSLKDVEVLPLPFPDHIPALANRAIEASYYQEPFTTIAVDRGLAVRGPIGYDIYPYQQIAVVIFGEKLAADRAVGLRYLRAYVRGVRDYVKAMIDRDAAAFNEVVPILIERTTVKDRALFEKAIPSGLKPDPVPNVQSIADDQEWFYANGFITDRVNLADFIDLSMVEEAIRQLGPAGR